MLAVRRNGQVSMGADGQVTVGELVMKASARKVRRIYHDQVLVGFSGATADAFSLFERFERQLEHFNGNSRRAAVELTREWRSDRFLRELEAWLLIAGREGILVLSGTGDVVEPDDELAAIGSGGPYAQAAAKALYRATELSATDITRIGLETAASMCIYTNDQISVDTITFDPAPSSAEVIAGGRA
ncbi:MAG: ATP-dependent HslUV protease, peptidase subunit HslV [Chloroflexota bacterium]|nr:ATP-dependent HslUV protease, peptidase subunit HslV [Chloroflexota bacterium]